MYVLTHVSLISGLVFITVTNEEVEFAAINTKFVLTAEVYIFIFNTMFVIYEQRVLD